MIIMYEDEEFFLKDYIEFIKDEGFKIEIFKDAITFLERVKNDYENIELFIIDIMVFGPGNEFNGRDTDEGTRSGLVLLDEIETIERKKGIENPKNKIVLTNRKGPVFDEAKRDKRVLMAIKKSDVLPSEFVEIIKREL
jgi:hypothetical protein